jgi:hypothetical protein
MKCSASFNRNMLGVSLPAQATPFAHLPNLQRRRRLVGVQPHGKGSNLIRGSATVVFGGDGAGSLRAHRSRA